MAAGAGELIDSAASPWLAPWRAHIAAVQEHQRNGADLHDALNAAAGETAAVRFVPQADLPAGSAYESYIFNSKQVPVRADWHDFFNGICWLGLPRAKRAMNALQAGELAARGAVGPRGPVRDALTLFDENGAVLQAPAELWQALVERDWRRLFTELRPLWPQARLLIVGHALLEQLLLSPRPGLCAHVLALPAPDAASCEAADAWLAPLLTPGLLATKPFVPLPVLGVPGWWPANDDPAFYADTRVFRPPRAGARRPQIPQ